MTFTEDYSSLNFFFFKKKSILSRLYVIRPLLKSNMNLSNRLLLYKSLLQPIWSYGIALWGTAKPSNLRTIQAFQSICLRMVTKAPCRSQSPIHQPNNNYILLKTHRKMQGHPNKLISNLHSKYLPGNSTRRLNRIWPRDLSKILLYRSSLHHPIIVISPSNLLIVQNLYRFYTIKFRFWYVFKFSISKTSNPETFVSTTKIIFVEMDLLTHNNKNITSENVETLRKLLHDMSRKEDRKWLTMRIMNIRPLSSIEIKDGLRARDKAIYRDDRKFLL
ncbi:ribosome biogenesis protein TSR3 isoform X1 [Aphis craccivora]|uniref:Ribosome biogenesis protein TSR3 isoform X1 n=1 Tax=Aphis craccivora TaxID=307492 RepID=A0A6G0ZHZ3_APHCR|nr:ribosome biogenesis protein TSR3 isoform X1 [Aphis craccivora]